MSWIQFLSWMLCIYAFYYSGLIAFDLSRNRRQIDAENANETTVVIDLPEPEKVSLKEIEDEEIDYFLDDGELEEPPIIFSGGVSIKELFALARSESIEYTSSVSF
ncbi:hypothetical protein ACUN24_20090 [Pedobacter sp. WC2501]|uniref:hypothetical protein n=1 Tax=Pedobacter sp. WC2501 TaxID=3461400 RepID=UPI0040457630